MISVTEVKVDDAGKAWDRYVLYHPLASGYHLTAWRRVVENTSGHTTIYLMASDEHDEAILPYLRMARRLLMVGWLNSRVDNPRLRKHLVDRRNFALKMLKKDYGI